MDIQVKLFIQLWEVQVGRLGRAAMARKDFEVVL